MKKESSLENKVSFLSEQDKLRSLSPKSIQAFAFAGTISTVRKGQAVVSLGTTAYEMTFLLQGKAQIQTEAANYGTLTIVHRTPFSLLSDVNIFSTRVTELPRQINEAVLLRMGVILSIGRQEYIHLLQTNPELAILHCNLVSENVGQLYKEVIRDRTLDAIGRVASLLLDLATDQISNEYQFENHRALRHNPLEVVLPEITQAGIAEQLGVTRVTVNRAFRQLENNGALRRHWKDVILVYPDQLSAFLDSDKSTFRGRNY